MRYRVLADLVLVAHFAFAAFTVLGGLLALRRRSLLWAHLASVCWGVVLQCADWTCPLTPLENYLRARGGEGGYRGGFVEHYVRLILYPENLTVELRYVLAAALVALNVPVYAYLLFRGRLTRR